MLKPRALADILSQTNTGGVQCTLLVNREGALLAYSGYRDKDARTTAALASSIWTNFERYGRQGFQEDKLNYTVVQLEVSYILDMKHKIGSTKLHIF